jgi:hypothetical protein
MKHLNNEAEQTKILDYYGAFFAFSNEQMDKYANQSVKYKSLGAGLYCPSCNVNNLTKELKESWDFKIKWELDNNQLKDIIWYQLANHETQITGDIDDACNALTPYGITKEDVQAEWGNYYQDCIDNDYF